MKTLDKITSPKVAILFCVAYIVYYTAMAMLTQYIQPLFTYKNAIPSFGWDILSYSTGMTVYLILPMLISEHPEWKLCRTIDKVCQPRIVVLSGYAFVIACVVLVFAMPGGILSSWYSLALLAIGVILTVSFLRDKVRNGIAVIIGIAIVCIWRAIWEIPYAISLRTIYEKSQLKLDVFQNLLLWDITFSLALLIGGIVILFYYSQKHKNIINFNWIFWLTSLTAVAAFVLWVIRGFEVHLIYNWSIREWINNPAEPRELSVFISKISKGVLIVGLAAMTIQGIKAGQIKAMVIWFVLTIGTSAFLIAKWILIKLLPKGKQHKPYFADRSILDHAN